MATDADESGFLSRWSRRKALGRQGIVVEEPAAAALALAPIASITPAARAQPLAPVSTPPASSNAAAADTRPLPTLAEVAELTHTSDYTRFVARGVQPEVKNAALSKLFSDPHFNVMDGLDTYIDDYGKPDPLPAGMLRKMVQSQLLGLFADEDKDKPAEPATLASHEPIVPPPLELAVDENTDLQLQPDDDAGRARAAPGPGEDTGRPH